MINVLHYFFRLLLHKQKLCGQRFPYHKKHLLSVFDYWDSMNKLTK